ncbi:hypothetical protein MKEN_01302200 [Mycena kentingensis (nom. inval.)]|nr:hypothetical protein MKEN_01302200 [Mycena kentingensis (nom. inval.)]
MSPLLHQRSSETSSTCLDIRDCRQLSDIIWSCIVTTFACVWVSVHPNVPPPAPHEPRGTASLWAKLRWTLLESHWGATWARLKLMLVALLAPELIFGFAMTS